MVTGSARSSAPVASIVGLLLILGGRLGFHLSRPLYAQLDTEGRAWVNVIYAWSLTLLVLAVVRFWEKQPWSSIGFRRMTRPDVLWAVAGFLLGGAILSATIPLVTALGLRSTEGGVRALGQLPFDLRILLVFTAGITEEIRYRGYLIERINLLTGSFFASAAISYVAFVLVHLPFWGLGGALQIGLGSLVLYALYWKRRNLPACMLMHVLNNAVAFLLIPILLPPR